MTLHEQAFMVDLIKRSYRRRMFYFCLNLLSILIPVIPLYWVKLSSPREFGAMVAMIVFIIRVIYIYFASDEYRDNLPWSIKKRQYKLLIANWKLDLEELRFCLPLWEYFHIKC